MKFIGSLNIPVLTSAPSSPVSGDIYFSSSTNKFYGYTGSSWVVLSATSSGDLPAHNLVDTAKHPVSGLTTGHVLRATGAAAYAFGAIQASDVPTLNQNTTGNAATASKWATTRTITLSGGVSSAASNIDGSANVSITTTLSSHAHKGTAGDGGQLSILDATTGTLTVGRGGTGTTSFTAGRVLFGNGTSALNTSTNLFWDNANSRLGIGTSSPTFKFEAIGAIKIGLRASIGQSGTDYDGFGYNVGFTSTSGSYTYIASDTASYLQMQSGGFQFKTAISGASGSALTLTERMRITQDGKVGIGSSTPSETLDVVGKIKSSQGFKTGSFEVVYNSTENSLDFVCN